MNIVFCSMRRLHRVARCVELAVMISVGFGAFLFGAAANAEDAAPAAIQDSSTQAPNWLRHAWVRDWIQQREVKSNTLDVHYLQTPTYFSDIRFPKDRPKFSSARSFADLTDQQLRILASQNGSSGLTKMAGPVAMWHHDMDFQPSDGTPDQGRLERIPPVRMHEHGLDGSYIEAWRSVSDGKGRFLVIRVEHSGRLLRSLVVVDDVFIYARNRAQDLPKARSFDALIAATNPTREQLVKYLDCEFSVGHVKGGSAPWEIEESTLPWREGHRLDFADQISVDAEHLSPAPHEVGEDQWTVPVNTLNPHEYKELFGGK